MLTGYRKTVSFINGDKFWVIHRKNGEKSRKIDLYTELFTLSTGILCKSVKNIMVTEGTFVLWSSDKKLPLKRSFEKKYRGFRGSGDDTRSRNLPFFSEVNMIDGEDFFQELKIIAIKKLEENKVDFVEEEILKKN